MKRNVSFAMAMTFALVGCAGDPDSEESGVASDEPSAATVLPDKAHAPGTDLVNYPKLPPPPPATGSDPVSSTVGSRGVSAVQIDADGGGSMTTYTPPDGLTDRQLYDVLKAQGIPGLQDPDAAAADGGTADPATLTNCAYGTARLLRCADDATPSHQVHWANNGYGHPQVYFVDHTGDQWPVTLSAWTWNRAHGIDSVYVWGHCPSYPGIHCVNLIDKNSGNSCFQGQTSVHWNSVYNITSASIEFNDYNGTGVCNGTPVNYAKNANGYRQDTCHEMGHALGMGHNTAATGSCLYGTIINSAAVLLPSSQDFTLIARLYSTTH